MFLIIGIDHNTAIKMLQIALQLFRKDTANGVISGCSNDKKALRDPVRTEYPVSVASVQSFTHWSPGNTSDKYSSPCV